MNSSPYTVNPAMNTFTQQTDMSYSDTNENYLVGDTMSVETGAQVIQGQEDTQAEQQEVRFDTSNGISSCTPAPVHTPTSDATNVQETFKPRRPVGVSPFKVPN